MLHPTEIKQDLTKATRTFSDLSIFKKNKNFRVIIQRVLGKREKYLQNNLFF